MKKENEKKNGTPTLHVNGNGSSKPVNLTPKEENKTPEFRDTNAPGAEKLVSLPATVPPASATIEERLQKVAQVSAMATRRDGIIAGLGRLAKYEFGSDRNSCKIVLTDAKGSAFESANPETIETVLSVLRNRAEQELKRTEEQIAAMQF